MGIFTQYWALVSYIPALHRIYALLKLDIVSLKRIFALAIPMIISGIFVPLQQMVDYAIVGRMGQDYLVAALGIAGLAVAFVFFIVSSMRMSAIGLTAQAFGAKDNQALALCLGRVIILGVLLGTVIIIFSPFIIEAWRFFFNTTMRVEDAMADYIAIRLYAFPLLGFLMGSMGFLLGIGRAKDVMVISIITNMVNIMVSSYFVFILNYGFKAVAWGTNIGELCGVLYCLYCLRKAILQHSLLLWQRAIIQCKPLLAIFRLNNDIMLRTVLLMLCFYYFNYISASFGEEYLAINNMIFNITLIGSFFLDGFANAAEAIVGQEYGKKDAKKMHHFIRQIFIVTMMVGFTLMLLFWLSSPYWLAILTNSKALSTLAEPYSIWPALTIFFGTACYIYDGIFIGLSQGKILRNSMLVAALSWLIFAYFLPNIWHNHGLWLALNIFYILRALPLWFAFRRFKI